MCSQETRLTPGNTILSLRKCGLRHKIENVFHVRPHHDASLCPLTTELKFCLLFCYIYTHKEQKTQSEHLTGHNLLHIELLLKSC